MYTEKQYLKLISQHKMECRQFEREIAALNLKLNAAHSNMELLKDKSGARKLFSEYTSIHNKFLENQEESAGLRKQIGALTTELRRAKATISAKDEEIHALKKKMARASESSSQHKTKCKDFEEKLKRMEDQRDGVNQELSRAKAEISDLVHKNSVHVASLKRSEEELQTRANEINELKAELDTWIRNYNLVNQDSGVMADNIKKLNGNLKDERKKMAALQKQHAEENRTKTILKIVEFKAAKDPISTLPEKNQIRALEKEISKKDKHIAELHAEMQALRDKTAKVLGEYESCRVELRKAKNKVKIRTADRDGFQRKVEHLQEQLGRGKSQLKKPLEERPSRKNSFKKKAQTVSVSQSEEPQKTGARALMVTGKHI